MPPTEASRQDCLIDLQLQLLRLQLHVLLVQLALVAHQAARGHAVDILPGQYISETQQEMAIALEVQNYILSQSLVDKPNFRDLPAPSVFYPL